VEDRTGVERAELAESRTCTLGSGRDTRGRAHWFVGIIGGGAGRCGSELFEA